MTGITVEFRRALAFERFAVPLPVVVPVRSSLFISLSLRLLLCAGRVARCGKHGVLLISWFCLHLRMFFLFVFISPPAAGE